MYPIPSTPGLTLFILTSILPYPPTAHTDITALLNWSLADLALKPNSTLIPDSLTPEQNPAYSTTWAGWKLDIEVGAENRNVYWGNATDAIEGYKGWTMGGGRGGAQPPPQPYGGEARVQLWFESVSTVCYFYVRRTTRTEAGIYEARR